MQNLEYQGTINDYVVRIRFNHMGFRCGYVVLPPTHPEHGTPYSELTLEYTPHGGLTYSEYEGDEWVIGFDCAHFGDAPDLDGFRAIGGNLSRFPSMPWMHGDIRSKEYVLNELRDLVAAVHNCY